ncbi:MAG: flagellar biosynthetic protein FliR [Hydrogenoanaerobacterium sp.]
MNIEFGGITLFIMVFVRIAAMILLNPLLARKNVPQPVRMGFVLFLTLLIAPTLPNVPSMSTFTMTLAMIREVFIGAVLGLVFQVFYYMLFFVGDFLDTEFGMSMAKVFDPGTNIQMSVSGNFLTVFLILYVFLTDSHLIMIQLFARSFVAIPPGTAILWSPIIEYGINLFIQVFSLAFRLLLPFAVAEFTLEVAMGVLMKIIPQIHIFVINFQLKLILGMTLLILCAPVIGSFLDNYIVVLLENMQRSLAIMSGL